MWAGGLGFTSSATHDFSSLSKRCVHSRAWELCAGRKPQSAWACQQRHSFKMLSWGERGKRKWEGPGVSHSGWEAWLQGLGLRLSLSGDGVLVPRHRCLAWASGLPVCPGDGKWGLSPRPRPSAPFNVWTQLRQWKMSAGPAALESVAGGGHKSSSRLGELPLFSVAWGEGCGPALGSPLSKVWAGPL